MNPSPAAIAAIKAFGAGIAGGWAGNNDVQMLAAIKAATVPNPVGTAPQVPKPFAIDDLTAVLDATGATNLAALATSMDQFLVDVDNQDPVRIQRWVRLLRTQGKLTAANVTALAGVVLAKQADPNWSATVPWDLTTLGRPIDIDDIAQTRAAS